MHKFYYSATVCNNNMQVTNQEDGSTNIPHYQSFCSGVNNGERAAEAETLN